MGTSTTTSTTTPTTTTSTTTTAAPSSTTTTTSTEAPTDPPTEPPTTSGVPVDIACAIKKGNALAAQLMSLGEKGRADITSADLSYNPRLDEATIQQLLAYLPNLKAVNLAGLGMGQMHPDLFKNNPSLKNINVSNNNIVCARGVFTDLKPKKINYGGNPALQKLTNRSKAKKGKALQDIETFDSIPKDHCIYV